jgi:hypothetical protein
MFIVPPILSYRNERLGFIIAWKFLTWYLTIRFSKVTCTTDLDVLLNLIKIIHRFFSIAKSQMWFPHEAYFFSSQNLIRDWRMFLWHWPVDIMSTASPSSVKRRQEWQETPISQVRNFVDKVSVTDNGQVHVASFRYGIRQTSKSFRTTILTL